MNAGDLDPAAFKAEQREDWNAVAAAWEAWDDALEQGAASVTARLLELGGVREGQRVLDLATGQGEPALTAARAVGPAGLVVGVDIAPEMLAVARRRAREAGLDHVTFVEGDLEALDQPTGSFDVALSRFGLMFAPDHLAAFRAVARVLAPGGVLAAAVWAPPPARRLTSGITAVNARLDLPPPAPGSPGAYAMSDPGRLADEAREAGFEQVSVSEQVAPFRFDSVERYARYTQELAPAATRALLRERFGSAASRRVGEIVAEAVEGFVLDGGAVSLPSVVLCLRAVRPAA
jgi:SAM-dependent methyltransferase